MSKTKISEFSTTPGNNTDINGINIAEGCAPSGINNAIRELMSDLKEWQSGAMDVYVIPQGTAAAPGIQLYGDLDTGLYGFAANQLGVAVGGASAGYFSSAGWVGNVVATTVDLTNIEVTNIKAKDGTAAITIADSTGIVSVSTQLAVDNLNLSGNTLSSSDTNGNIILAPNGTGDVYLDADTIRVGDSNTNVTITSNGTADLILNTNSGTNSGSITIQDGVNGNILIATNGTGQIQLTGDLDVANVETGAIKARDGTASATIADSTGVMTIASSVLTTTDINGGTIDNTVIGGATTAAGSFTTLTATQLDVDNLRFNDNTISATNTNGNIELSTPGTGDIYLNADTVRIGDANVDVTLTTNGNADLILNTNSGSLSGSITIQDGVNNNILISPNGTGQVQLSGALDVANIEVTNIKAKDGTASITLADSTGQATFSANPLLNAGTADGVLYLNASKVATSGSALTFDGTNLATSGSIISSTAPAGGSLKRDVTSSYLSVTGGTSPNTNGATIFLSGSTYVAANTAFIDAAESVFRSLNGASEYMRLTSTGLGIGTSSPYSKLYVKQGADGTPTQGITLEAAANDNRLVQYYHATNNEWVISATYGSTGAFKPFTWWTSDTKRMTLDSSGNLGLGAASGSTARRLTVYSSATSASATSLVLQHSTSGTGSTDGYTMELDGATAYLWNYENGALLFGTNNTERARISSDGTFRVKGAGTAGTTDAFQVAGTAPADAARIDSSGNLLVGTTTNTSYGGSVFSKDGSNANALAILNTASSFPYGPQIEFTAAAPNDATRYFVYCRDTGGERATIRSNGGLANYQGNDVNLSDRREKTNFAPAKSYLDTICAIPVQTFNYIDQSEDDPGLTLGVVAQDVQAVAPELVMESNWGSKEDPKMRLSIYQTDLQYALMKCIQEQQAMINELKAEVAALKGA